jgi:hypothetical protein
VYNLSISAIAVMKEHFFTRFSAKENVLLFLITG